jgi:HTH-type transcriptional regulator/antitoxin HigA
MKEIKTEEEYELAIKRIDELMDAEANTPELNELEALVEMVGEYEDALFPITNSDIKQFNINMSVYHRENKYSKDDITDMFIEWVEGKGMFCGGVIEQEQ